LPDTAEYLERIRRYAQGNEPLSIQQETPTVLEELISSASEQQLTTRPSQNKWSVGEILAHLAEDEIATAWRYRQMLEHSGIELAGFDQDLWARTGEYGSRLPQESLTLFRLVRAANLQFLRHLAPEQWECYGIHAERGRITIRELAAHMAGHDGNHVEQIRKLLQ
jgi:uncharacterized damage-inducible protein DinB